MSTIVIAAIALIVLVVLIAIFSNSSGKTVDSINDCASKGGECASGSSCDNPQYPIPLYVSEDSCSSKLCCLKVTNE